MKVKVKIILTEAEVKEKIAKSLGFQPDEIELEINESAAEAEPAKEPIAEAEPAKEPTESDGSDTALAVSEAKPKRRRVISRGDRFFTQYITEKYPFFSISDIAELCGVSRNTINRACSGYCLRTPSYLAIVQALGMTQDEAKQFKKSLTRHQRDYRAGKKE